MPIGWYAFKAHDIDFLSNDRIDEGFFKAYKQSMLFDDLVRLECLSFMLEYPGSFNAGDLRRFTEHVLRKKPRRDLNVHDCVFAHVQHYAHKFAVKPLKKVTLADDALPETLSQSLTILKQRAQEAYITLEMPLDHTQTYQLPAVYPLILFLALSMMVVATFSVLLLKEGVIPTFHSIAWQGFIALSAVALWTEAYVLVIGVCHELELHKGLAHTFKRHTEAFETRYAAKEPDTLDFATVKLCAPALTYVYAVDDFVSCESGVSPRTSPESSSQSLPPGASTTPSHRQSA